MGATSRCHTAKRPNPKTKLLAKSLRNARCRSDHPVHTTAAPPRTSGTFPCRRLIPLLLSSMRRLFHRLVAAIVKNVLGEQSREELCELLRRETFSLLVDMPTDRGTIKRLSLVARVGNQDGDVVDASLALVPIGDASDNVQPHKLLHPSQTRWLSLQVVVTRLLEQMPALILFFKKAATEDHLLAAETILNKRQ
ncbi:hypothetical protein HPB47_000752 [Ixodes persulcatus]|uniref:Uncharacterized protein n=1 Tax=Ixodes persulcatus TaxID=34615 RepID=A0AC60PR74_IXOPE|nr:hypothetical protein HPB47_000752 [Ixodes persulcatus]